MTTLLQYADTIGDGTGAQNATGDYRSALQEFKVSVPSGQTLLARRLIVTIQDDVPASGSHYGGDLTLAKGIEIQIRNSSNQVMHNITSGSPIYANIDFVRLGKVVDPLAGDDEVVQCIIDLKNTRIRSGERLAILLNDDFRTLTHHSFRVQGRVEGHRSPRTTFVPAIPATPPAGGYNGTIKTTLKRLTTRATGLYDVTTYRGNLATTLSGLTTVASGTFTAPAAQFHGDLATTLSGLTTVASGTFTPPVGGTTPLSQPGWLDEAEVYAYQKLGLEYNASTYETIFDESNSLVATNNSTLAAHLSTAKSNSAIRAIYLDPAGSPYTFPSNPTSGVNRSISTPLVIRKLPGGGLATCNQVFEQNYISNIAYVDLTFLNGFRMIGGCDNLLIEKCSGWLDLQGKRNPDATPTNPMAKNVQVRLCTMVDHWAMSSTNLTHGIFTFNMDGLLFEGNILDHNGWDPAATRATNKDSGGPTTRKHNCYFNQPGPNYLMRFNFCSRASSHGFHMKSGGICYQNVMVRNPINIQCGYGNDNYINLYGVALNPVVRDNLGIDSDDINTDTGDLRGVFIWTTAVDNFLCARNVGIDDTTTTVNSAYLYVERNHPIDMTLEDAVSKNWYGDILYRGTNNFTPVINQINTQFNVTGLSAPAQSLANTLKSDTYIDNLKTTRSQLGVDIYQLKSDIATIVAGIIP